MKEIQGANTFKNEKEDKDIKEILFSFFKPAVRQW